MPRFWRYTKIEKLSFLVLKESNIRKEDMLIPLWQKKYNPDTTVVASCTTRL